MTPATPKTWHSIALPPEMKTRGKKRSYLENPPQYFLLWYLPRYPRPDGLCDAEPGHLSLCLTCEMLIQGHRETQSLQNVAQRELGGFHCPGYLAIAIIALLHLHFIQHNHKGILS